MLDKSTLKKMPAATLALMERLAREFRVAYSPAQLLRGYRVELEHRDVTGGDPRKTFRIVLAHLRERSDYYELLSKVEKRPTGRQRPRRSSAGSPRRAGGAAGRAAWC